MGKLKTLPPRVQSAAGRLAVMEPGSWRTEKQKASSTARGYGYRWQKARTHFLRHHPLCAYCERAGRVMPATVVDHRIPHRGNQELFWDEGNWQSLCKHCHDAIKQAEESALQME